MTARYITTTLPYVNADPHIGFAVEILQADVLARLWRLQGDEVFFNTGTDEHGQKIFESAKSAGEDVEDYVNRHAGGVRKLKEALNLSTDTFIRTTDENHIKAAQELWKICDAKGDIEKKKYKGLYCVGCEKYLTERDLENGKCPLHPDEEPKIVEEENYFFKLSKYKKQLEDYLGDQSLILPEHRRQEALELVRGAEDFSISREKAQLSWGVPVPGDDEQTMYVWFDALTNYISTLGWPEDKDGNFKKFWEEGETLQVAGKDQIRFQSLMWQAMLMSAGISRANKIFYHGFITSGGQKMSKSIGNVISPLELVEKYGTDATRYLLLRHVHPFEDTDVTWERLDEWYEANLVNGLGNLVARVMQLAETHLDEKAEIKSQEEIDKEAQRDIFPKISEFRFDYALDHIFVDHVGSIDQKITDTEPFKIVKENEEKGKKLIAELVSDLFTVSGLLEPFLPETSEKILKAVKENKKPENLFPRL